MASGIRDCEYGDYKDFDLPYHWTDDFWPSKESCKKARAKFDEAVNEVLEEIAHDLGLDTSEWDSDDYWTLREELDI